MRVRELRVSYGPAVATVEHSLMRTPWDSVQILRPILGHEPSEVFGALLLTTKLHMIGWFEIGRGSVNQTVVDVAGAVRAALLANAAQLVLAHNHPSGDPQPSAEDHAVTTRLIAAAALFGIDVLDHIIIGAEPAYFSFKEGGRL